MRKRAVICGSSKSVPPFFGRQLRARSRGVERMFAFNSGKDVEVQRCPNRFRRVLSKVFQGIQVAKTHLPETAAEIFNKALQAHSEAIMKFISFGLKAVSCVAVAGELVLELAALADPRRVIILHGAPAAFVAR